MDISLINPYIRVAIPSVLRRGTVISQRAIFDYELIYIEEGDCILNFNGKDHKCSTGDFVLLRPGISHSFRGIENELSQPHVHFDVTHAADSYRIPISFKDIDAFSDDERSRIREDVFGSYADEPFVFFSDMQKAMAVFYEIIDSQKSELRRKAKLTELIDMLISDNFGDLFGKKGKSFAIEEQIKDFIDAGQGMSLCLDDFAKQFNYNKFYLERCFKESFGVGLIAYRNRKRIELAREMLVDDTVSAVSEKLGFSSIYVFSRAFKNYFGYSPTEYIKNSKRAVR